MKRGIYTNINSFNQKKLKKRQKGSTRQIKMYAKSMSYTEGKHKKVFSVEKTALYGTLLYV